MKILVVGQRGQLAQSLQRSAPSSYQLECTANDQLDISDPIAVSAKVEAYQPDWIINAAAYTAVDQAESDAERADAINHLGAKYLAAAAKNTGASLLQVSTDFVFDGQQGKPYATDSETAPLGVYGRSKRDGELAVANSGAKSCIVRTSWVFSPFGNNFVKTMLRLMQERDSLNVVDDQIGSPSSALALANFLWELVAHDGDLPQYLHWTNNGVCSWYDFAVTIERLGRESGLLTDSTTINPIPAKDYPTPAQRPHYSVLDKSLSWQYAAPAAHWELALREVIQQLSGN